MGPFHCSQLLTRLRRESRRRRLRAVPDVQAEHCAAILLSRLVVGDVAFFLEDAGDLGLQLRRRYIQLLVPRTDGVADTRHKIGYWISQTHSLSSIPRSLRPGFFRTAEPAGMLWLHGAFIYQLDLTTPGISPR